MSETTTETQVLPPEGVEIRHVKLGELSALQELYELYVDEIDDPMQALDANRAMVVWQMKRGRQQMLASQRYLACVAWQGDEAVGYVSAIIEEQAAVYALASYGDIAEIYVRPENRRRGLGRALMAQITQALDTVGVSFLKASAPLACEGSKFFLEALGFAAIRIDMIRRPI